MSTSQPPKLALGDVFNALQRHMLADSSHQICFHEALSQGPGGGGGESDNAIGAAGAGSVPAEGGHSSSSFAGSPGWWETVCLLKGILLLQKRMRQRLSRPKRLGSLKRLFSSSHDRDKSSDGGSGSGGGRGARLFQHTMAIDLRLVAYSPPTFPSERRVVAGSLAKPFSQTWLRQRQRSSGAESHGSGGGSGGGGGGGNRSDGESLEWLDPLLSWNEQRNGRRAARLDADPPAVHVQQSNHSREHDEQVSSALEWELHRVAPPWALLPEAEAMLEAAPRSGETHRYKCVKETDVFRVNAHNATARRQQQPQWPWEPARGKKLRPGDIIFVTDMQILREPAHSNVVVAGGGSQATTTTTTTTSPHLGNGKVVVLHGNGKYFSVLLSPALYHIAPQAELEELDHLNDNEEDDDDRHGVEDIMRQLAAGGGGVGGGAEDSSSDPNAGTESLSSAKNDDKQSSRLIEQQQQQQQQQQQPEVSAQNAETVTPSNMAGSGEEDVSVEVFFESVRAWDFWSIEMEEKVLDHLTQSKVSWNFNASTAPLHGAFIRRHGKQLVQPLLQVAGRDSAGREASAGGVKPLDVGELRHFARHYCSAFGQLCTAFWASGERVFVAAQSENVPSSRGQFQKHRDDDDGHGDSDSEDSFAAPFPVNYEDGSSRSSSDEEYQDEMFALDARSSSGSSNNAEHAFDLAGLDSFLATEAVCQATKAERPSLLAVVQTLQAQARAVTHFRARLNLAQQWLSAARTLPFEAQVRMNAHDAADGAWKVGRVVGMHSDPVPSHFPVFHTSDSAEEVPPFGLEHNTVSRVHHTAFWFDILYDDGSVEIGVAREHIDSSHLDRKARGSSGSSSCQPPVESHQPHASSPRLRRDWSFTSARSRWPFRDSSTNAAQDPGPGAVPARFLATLQLGDRVTVRFGFGQVVSGLQARCQTDPDLHILRLAASVPRYARSLLRCTTSAADYVHKLGDDRVGLLDAFREGVDSDDGYATRRRGTTRRRRRKGRQPTLIESAYDVFLVDPGWLEMATTDHDSTRATENLEDGSSIDSADYDSGEPSDHNHGVSTPARRHFVHFKHWRACPSASSPLAADRAFCARLASDTHRATRIVRGAALHLCEPCTARLKLLERLAARDRRSFATNVCVVYVQSEFSLSAAGRKVAQRQRKQQCVDITQQFLAENQELLRQSDGRTTPQPREFHGGTFPFTTTTTAAAAAAAAAAATDGSGTESSFGTSTLDLARVVSGRMQAIAEHKRDAPELYRRLLRFFKSIGVDLQIDGASARRELVEELFGSGTIMYQGRRCAPILDWVLQPSPLRGLGSQSQPIVGFVSMKQLLSSVRTTSSLLAESDSYIDTQHLCLVLAEAARVSPSNLRLFITWADGSIQIVDGDFFGIARDERGTPQQQQQQQQQRRQRQVSSQSWCTEVLASYNRGVYCLNWGLRYHTLDHDLWCAAEMLNATLHPGDSSAHEPSSTSQSADTMSSALQPSTFVSAQCVSSSSTALRDCHSCGFIHAPMYCGGGETSTVGRPGIGPSCYLTPQGYFDVESALNWLTEFCGDAALALRVLKEGIRRRWISAAEASIYHHTDLQLFRFRSLQLRCGWNSVMPTTPAPPSVVTGAAFKLSAQLWRSSSAEAKDLPPQFDRPLEDIDIDAGAQSGFAVQRRSAPLPLPQSSSVVPKWARGEGSINCFILNDPAPANGGVTQLHLHLRNAREANQWQVHVMERVLGNQAQNLEMHHAAYGAAVEAGNCFLRVATYRLGAAGQQNPTFRAGHQTVDVRSWGMWLKEGQFLGFSRSASFTPGSTAGVGRSGNSNARGTAGAAAAAAAAAAVGRRNGFYTARPSFRGANGRHDHTPSQLQAPSLNMIGTSIHSFTSWVSALTFDGGAGVGGAGRETHRDIQMWATEVAPVPLTFCALCRGDGWVTQAHSDRDFFPDAARESRRASSAVDERIEAECAACGRAVLTTTLQYEPPMSVSQFTRNVAIATPVRKHAIAIGFTFVPQAFLSKQFGSSSSGGSSGGSSSGSSSGYTRSSSGPSLGHVAAAKAKHKSAVASKLEQNSFFQTFCCMLTAEAARIYSLDRAVAVVSPSADFSGTNNEQRDPAQQQGTFFDGIAFARAVELVAQRLSRADHSTTDGGASLTPSRFELLQFGSDLVRGGFLRSAAAASEGAAASDVTFSLDRTLYFLVDSDAAFRAYTNFPSLPTAIRSLVLAHSSGIQRSVKTANDVVRARMNAASRRQLLDGGVFNPGVEGSQDSDEEEEEDGEGGDSLNGLNSAREGEAARHVALKQRLPAAAPSNSFGGGRAPRPKKKSFPDGPVFAMERSIVKWAETSVVPSDRGVQELLSRRNQSAAAGREVQQSRTRGSAEGLAKQVTDMMMADNLPAIRNFLRRNVAAAAGHRRRGGKNGRSAVRSVASDSSDNDDDDDIDDNDGEAIDRMSRVARTLRDDRTGYSLLHLAALFDATTVAGFLLQQQHQSDDQRRLFPSAYLGSTASSKNEALLAMDLLLEPAEARWVLDSIQVAGDDPHLRVFAAAAAAYPHHFAQHQQKPLPARAVVFRHFDKVWVYDPITGQLSGSQQKFDGAGWSDHHKEGRRRGGGGRRGGGVQGGYFEAPQHSLALGGLGLGKEADFVNMQAAGGSGGGDTALHLACAAGSLRLVRLLVASRADPNIRNYQGLSAMAVAAQQPQAHALHAAMV